MYLNVGVSAVTYLSLELSLSRCLRGQKKIKKRNVMGFLFVEYDFLIFNETCEAVKPRGICKFKLFSSRNAIILADVKHVIL